MGLGVSEVKVSDSLGVVRPRSSRHTTLDDSVDDPSALSSADTVTGPEDAVGLVYDATAGMVLGRDAKYHPPGLRRDAKYHRSSIDVGTFSDEVTLL